MTIPNKPKLEVEMIPSTNFYNNVRSAVTQYRWDVIRKNSYEKANHKCEICGETGKEQGYGHSVECHEIWDYNFLKKIQKLIGLISLCPRCHMCKHIGRAFAVGKQAEVFLHLEKINKWTHKEVVDYLAEVFMEHYIRSQENWVVDLEYLVENCGVDKLVVENAKKGTNKPKRTYFYKKSKSKNKYKKKPSTKSSPTKKGPTQ